MRKWFHLIKFSLFNQVRGATLSCRFLSHVCEGFSCLVLYDKVNCAYSVTAKQQCPINGCQVINIVCEYLKE